jgi:hypothetical protein
MESSRVISTELFPYDKFGFRLEFGDKKNPTICWFECQEHLDKYLERYKLDSKTTKIDYRDGKPADTSKKRKGSMEQKPKPKSKGSSSTSKGRKPSVDSTRNTTRPTKRKK